MSDAVDRVLSDRQALDRGFPGSVLASSGAHAVLVALAFGAPLLFPARPLLKVQDGFVVALPPGGGGSPNVKPAAAAQPQPAPPQPEPPPPPKADPAPRILKPPKETPKKGLPEPDARRKSAPERTPPPQPAGGAAGGAGSSTQTPGLEFGPAGPGVPGGTDPFGDWYLAGVQRKIWLLWSQQVRTGAARQVTVAFTIQQDGSVSNVHVVEPSGIFLLDQAAQRAIISAAPFGPLPKDYGTKPVTIQAIFRPTP